MIEKSQSPLHERERRRAFGTLEQLREEPALGGSALRHAARRAVRHFAGKDPPIASEDHAADRTEIWARRIGRGLSLLACIGLAIYLYVAYVR